MKNEKSPEPRDETPDVFTTAIQKLYSAEKIDTKVGKYKSIPELVEKHGKVLTSEELQAVKERFPMLFKK